MARTPMDSFGAREQVILSVIILAIGFGAMLLFIQQKLLYYFIGMILLGVLSWCQFNVRRWIYLTFIFMPLSPSIQLFPRLSGVSIELCDFVNWATIFVFFMNLIVNPSLAKRFDKYLLMPLLFRRSRTSTLYVLSTICTWTTISVT
jgi:hypothetical protein